jgi:hypothetical protein
MAGTSGTSAIRRAGLAVLSAVSARRFNRKAGAVQSRLPAVAAGPIRHGRTTAAAAAATTLANYHGQHD